MAAAPDNTDDGDWRKNKAVLQCNKYMYENKIDCDVTFAVGPAKEVIAAHKYVLISRSAVFYAMLSGPLANSTQNIEVPDIDPETFKKLLQYIYYEDTRMEIDEAYNILYAAKKYGIEGLVERCVRLMKTRMTHENVCWILAHSEMYGDQETKQACLDYFFRYSATSIQSASFTDLSASLIEEILNANKLNLPPERIFEALVMWSEKECQRQNLPVIGDNQRKVLGNLLNSVDFSQMDVTYFSEAVSNSGILPQEKVIALFRSFLLRQSQSQVSNAPSYQEPSATASASSSSAQGLMQATSAPQGTASSAPALQEPTASASAAGATNQQNNLVISIHERERPRNPQSIVPLHQRNIVKRFRNVMSGKAYQRDNKDCLAFISSEDIILQKILIFGSHQKAGQYRIEFRVFEDGDHQLFYKNVTINTDGAVKEYEIELTPPLRIQKEKVYTLDMLMKGPASFYGTNGMHFVAVDGVNFTFVTNEEGTNGTNIRIGQFPGMIFEKCSSS